MQIGLQPSREQHLARWKQLAADPELAKLPHTIETDRFGRIIITPPEFFPHALTVAAYVKRALLGTLAYTFARIGALVNLKVEDCFQTGKRSMIRFRERGGKKDPKRRFQNPVELLKALPTITGAIDTRGRITRQSLQKKGAGDSHTAVHTPAARLGPKKISIARLPVTGSNFFGREADIAFLDEAWANQQINVVAIVAWAGAGKSTLVNQWLLRMAAEHYRSAELVFGWSFYRQGTSGRASSADEFLDAALTWFGDPDPRLGTAWEKGERLAKLIANRRTLLILDGLEPLQNPPGPQEGRLRDPSLQALLRGLASFINGLCVITTRLPVADVADRERRSVLRYDLEQLSSEAGAQLLRALSVIGDEEKLRCPCSPVHECRWHPESAPDGRYPNNLRFGADAV